MFFDPFLTMRSTPGQQQRQPVLCMVHPTVGCQGEIGISKNRLFFLIWVHLSSKWRSKIKVLIFEKDSLKKNGFF
jgi:hypothetical protein